MIYAVAISSTEQRGNNINFNLRAVVVQGDYDQKAAESLGLEIAKTMWPETAGYFNHASDAYQVEKKLIVREIAQ